MPSHINLFYKTQLPAFATLLSSGVDTVYTLVEEMLFLKKIRNVKDYF